MSATTKRAIVIVGSLVALLMVLALALPAVGQIVVSTSQRTDDLPTDLTSLTLDNGVGDITVRAADAGERPSARATVRSGLTTPEVDVTVDGDTASISDTCQNSWWDNCSVSWTVVVPEDATLALTSSVGDITVTGTTAPLTVASSVGGITAQDISSPTVRANGSVGDVTVDFTAPPESVEVSASTGDVTVTVPDDGTAYHVQTNTSLGEVHSGMGSDPAATHLIDVRTSVGDVFLRRN